ncbi:DNA replication protein DnaD [Paenibacillus baekrokdamisoli]|uniref:DNA replication protein DnaD n=1 Tax=Paenibacillus baekrokdamisoli TaxID=1712516 RepID=A0A3G9J7S5_9BACL|nr:DnaD domain-containing protein [Paenibacillus baekrokdamisoli]MBB3069703.1 DNA replication protein [Paenibacillus baekrokdamisoli]BBH20943.1 DNA replication protein DnaD [Paenibacillus baekrokdamisoli]
MKNDMWKAYARGMAAAMNSGGVVVPAGLLRAYRGIGLSDGEMLLIIQLLTYRQIEQVEFPTPEQLADRLGLTSMAVGQMLSRLMKEGLLAIDEQMDLMSGIQSERYNWNGLIIRSAEWLADDAKQSVQNDKEQQQRAAASAEQPKASDLFTVIEQEFGRPLSPMECETISAWLDQDKYPDELIRFALKEAVFAGKLHFRYIDRILIEWSRNRVTNTDEAKAHTQKFRGGRGSS